MSENLATTAKYIYGIIRCAQPRQFSSPGIGARGDVVHTVTCDGLAAVVSDSPLIEYAGSRRHLMAHMAVLAEVMNEFSVLPVRFGTIAPSAQAIQDYILRRRQREISDQLEKLEGRFELGLKVFWHEDLAIREVVAENASVRALRDRLAGRSPEETYYERIKLGELVETAINRKRQLDAQAVLERLRPLSEDLSLKKIIADRMVLNATFLVKRERELEFNAATQQLDAELGARLSFKYIGSAPPYSFVNLLLSWGA